MHAVMLSTRSCTNSSSVIQQLAFTTESYGAWISHACVTTTVGGGVVICTVVGAAVVGGGVVVVGNVVGGTVVVGAGMVVAGRGCDVVEAAAGASRLTASGGASSAGRAQDAVNESPSAISPAARQEPCIAYLRPLSWF